MGLASPEPGLREYQSELDDETGGQVEVDPRDQLLEPIIFTKKDIEAMRTMQTREIWSDPRFLKLLGEHQDQQSKFDRVLEHDNTLTGEEIQKIGLAFRIALLNWETTIARLERVVEYQEGDAVKTRENGNVIEFRNKPYDIDEIAKFITNAAREFHDALKELGYVSDPQHPRLQGRVDAEIQEGIDQIRDRVFSVVVYENAPVANSESQRNRDLGGLSNLRTVGEITSIPLSADLHFKGSKRSDIASTTNGDQLIKNLEQIDLDPEKFEIFTLRLSDNPVVLVVPRAAQGQIGLDDLFKDVGVILSEKEVSDTPDIFFLGVPDEIFEGVEGIIQGKNGDKKQVDAGYKRFHYTRADGSTIYVVGNGKDSSGNQIDYFGPYKKAPYQVLATRQVQESTQKLTHVGIEATQPDERINSRFRFPDPKTEQAEITPEFLEQICLPFHGTSLLWGRWAEDITLDDTIREIKGNWTQNHTIFEGQSGMGKSEMELFIRVILERLRHLFTLLINNESYQKDKSLAGGLAELQKYQLFSAGDDMGQLEFRVFNGVMALYARTHEKARFTRTDNVPAQEFVARRTYPIDSHGNPTQTTNTRVLQVDDELDKLHEIPINVRNIVLASNLAIPVKGIDPNAVVQEVSYETYLEAYAHYVNQPNGTKDSDEPVQSTAAMHEFIGQFSVAGGQNCKNIVNGRRFMIEREMERRKTNGSPKKMKFFIVNTGIKPDWMEEEEYKNLTESDRQKLHFAFAASEWSSVKDLIPEPIRAAFKHAKSKLNIDLAELAFRSENWSIAQLEEHLARKLRTPVSL